MTVEKHAGDGGTLQLRVQYWYDALGDRIERTEDSNKDGNVDTTERFGYDGQDVWADLDGNNGLTYRRLFGPGVDDPVARITAAGTVVWYLLDYQNSVIGMVDSTGSSLGSISYDGFGNILTNTTGVNGDRYGFTSRELDLATGDWFYRARYYNAAIGKWTSMDPLGFAAGDANLYRYVGNGPTNGVDPSGEDSPPFTPPGNGNGGQVPPFTPPTATLGTPSPMPRPNGNGGQAPPSTPPTATLGTPSPMPRPPATTPPIFVNPGQGSGSAGSAVPPILVNPGQGSGSGNNETPPDYGHAKPPRGGYQPIPFDFGNIPETNVNVGVTIQQSTNGFKPPILTFTFHW